MGAVPQNEHLLLAVLAQLMVMVGAARLLNTAFRKCRQPGVIGEIIAGLLLGPSCFGHVFPETSAAPFAVTAS